MIEQHPWHTSRTTTSSELDPARDEPSHIHVPRPSRVLGNARRLEQAPPPLDAFDVVLEDLEEELVA